MFTVYVLFSPSFNKTYTGYSSDFKARFLSHNELATKGFTIKYRPWIVLYTEQLPNKSKAIRREKQLKSGKGRDFIRKLIEAKGWDKISSGR